jgi:large subunit ribosomal protein L13
MKTTTPTKQHQQDKKWFIVDAEGKVLGRLATRLADVLRGKHKPHFSPHMDLGDHVIVINAGKIAVTGAKMHHKLYFTHSGYAGHLKLTTLENQLQKRPFQVIQDAVRGMLPKNKLRDVFMSKLHLYEGTEHKHEAQQPVPLTF